MSTDIQTLTKEKIKLDEPGLYDVIFLNDNITTMEFVVKVLKQKLTSVAYLCSLILSCDSFKSIVLNLAVA